MKFSIAIFLSALHLIALCQSSTATYTAGDIGSDDASGYNAATSCNGDDTPLILNIPAGATVTSIDVSYSITAPASGGGWTSEQRSQIYCQETLSDEGGFISGTSVGGTNSSGTLNYSRTGLTLANGVSASGTLTFEMRTYRTWTGTAGCNSAIQKVDNNTWTITVYYNVPVAQSFISSIATQSNTSSFPKCSDNIEILGIEVVMNGTVTPLSLTSMQFQTTGSTAPLSDISNIDLYYTDNSNSFSTSNLFGSVSPSASGVNFSINGTQTLTHGTNYFWLVYDISNGASTGNIIDAICNQITISGNTHTPSITNPSGSRAIDGCTPYPGGIDASNLSLWLKANDGITLNGTDVQQWNDQSGNANNATSPVGQRPNIFDNTLYFNFNPTVHFTTPNASGVEHMVIANQPNLNPVTMSVFVVGRASGNGGTWSPYLIKTESWEWNNGFGINHQGNSPHFQFWKGQWDGNSGPMDTDYPNITYPLWNHPNLMAGFSDLSDHHASLNNSTLLTLPHDTPDNWPCTQDMLLGAYNAGSFGTPYLPSNLADPLDGDISEIVLYDRMLSASERLKVSSYLAIKYGLTLGTNGTSMNYTSSSATIVWNQANNIGFNYDIAGIGFDEATGLDQPKSHSTNQSVSIGTYNDILTISNGTNFASPSSISTDLSYLVWGHDNDPTHNTNATVNYPTDNGEIIQTIFQREWKSQETGTVNTVTLEFDLSNVIGPGGLAGTNDLQYCRLLVDEDGDYSDGGATSIAPTSYNNATGIVYFEHDFQPPSGPETTQHKGYFFTLGSTNVNLSPLAVTFDNFDFDCHNSYTTYSWQTQNEHESSHFELYLAQEDMNFDHVATVQAQGESNSTVDYHVDINYSRAVYAMVLEYNQNGEVTEYGPYSVNCGLEQLIVYPNPAEETLYIHYPGSDDFEVDLYDAMGKKVLQGLNSHQLDISQLSSGVYMLEINSNELGTYNERIVKN